MGYDTKFEGVLKFTTELTASQLAYLNTILGEDARGHPEWGEPRLTHMDLGLTDDFAGLEWPGVEKTYDLVEKTNLIIRLMQAKWPEFGLKGSLSAQGEEYDDRWDLVITEEGWAEKRDIKIVGTVVECPYCEEKFVLE